MKKMLAALACLVMLTGCSGQNAKIGVGISTSLTKSASASEEPVRNEDAVPTEEDPSDTKPKA